MASILLLEQGGRWRAPSVAGLLLLGGLPIVPLVLEAGRPGAPPLDHAFWSSLWRTAAIAGGASLLGGVVGLPLGVGAALYDVPGGRAFLALAALPLLVPSFLCAIGWSMLTAHLPRLVGDVLGGWSGCLVVATTVTIPLVLFATFSATHELSRSQVEGVRIGGGDGRVLRAAIGHGLPPALFAAVLGGILTLSDPGPGQVLGAHTVASEILTSFAARYDFPLAARQCLALSLLTLAFSVPLAVLGRRRLARTVLARQATRPAVEHRRGGIGVAAGFVAVTVVTVGLPVYGLVAPLAGGLSTLAGATAEVAARDHAVLVVVGALATATRTAENTLVYACGAAVVATALGLALAFAVGRSAPLRALALSVAIALFSWPAAATALGTVGAAAPAPAWLDPLLRSRLTVCIVVGLRLLPVSAVLALRAWGAMAPSWARAAALHGVPLSTYLRRVVWPSIWPSAACSFVLVGLLASADVPSVLLLHPPGEASLPLSIFTVMANAPEQTVAALCMVYLVAALAALSVALRFIRSET